MSTIIIAVIVSIVATIGCLSYFVAGPDNKVEEACEEIIKLETGEEIDLSPSTPEEIELQQAPLVTPVAGPNGTCGIA